MASGEDLWMKLGWRSVGEGVNDPFLKMVRIPTENGASHTPEGQR